MERAELCCLEEWIQNMDGVLDLLVQSWIRKKAEGSELVLLSLVECA